MNESHEGLSPVCQEVDRERIYQWEDYIDNIGSDPYKVPILFDVGYPTDEQIRIAREMRNRTLNDIADPESPRYIEQTERKSFPQYRPRDFALHIQLLDADANGASLEGIAEALYPNEENGYGSGNRVTKRVRNALKRAKIIRDQEYWLIHQ